MRSRKGAFTANQVRRAVAKRLAGKHLDLKEAHMVAAWGQASGMLPGPAIEAVQLARWVVSVAAILASLSILVIIYVATR